MGGGPTGGRTGAGPCADAATRRARPADDGDCGSVGIAAESAGLLGAAGMGLTAAREFVVAGDGVGAAAARVVASRVSDPAAGGRQFARLTDSMATSSTAMTPNAETRTRRLSHTTSPANVSRRSQPNSRRRMKAWRLRRRA